MLLTDYLETFHWKILLNWQFQSWINAHAYLNNDDMSTAKRLMNVPSNFGEFKIFICWRSLIF